MPKEYSQEDIQKLIDDAIAPIKAKNTELLGKLAKAKTLDGIDLELLKADSEKLKTIEQEKLESEGKWQEAYETLKGEHGKTVDDLKTANEKLQTDFDTAMIKNEVTIGLMGLNVIGDLSEVAVTTLMAQAEKSEDGKIMFGELDAETFMKEWADGPVGKHFIKSGNTGGNANGSDAEKLQNSFETYFKEGTVNHTKQLELKTSSPEVFKILDDKYNAKKSLPSHSTGMV